MPPSPAIRSRPATRAAILAFALVSLIGGSLVVLRHQDHAVRVRQMAKLDGARAAEALGQQLAAAIRAAEEIAARSSESRQWVAGDRAIVLDAKTPRREAEELARDFGWLAAVDAAERRGSAILGPARRAAGWMVLARTAMSGGWAVVAADLNEIIRLSGMGRLADAGYDYQLLYQESRRARPAVITGTVQLPIEDAIRTDVPLTQSAWAVAVAPRGGWPGWLDLAVHACLVSIAALFAALLAYEQARRPQKLRVQLRRAAHRLQAANRRLAEEIQQRESIEQRASHADFHDPFTGLPNRRHFMNALTQGLKRARRESGFRVAVVVLDFDRFTAINTLLGHGAADEFLALAASRLEHCIPGRRLTVARLGDDQFGIVLPGVPSPYSALDAARLLQDALVHPFELGQQRVVCAASAGIACSSAAPQRAEDLLREADLALSNAKGHGGSGCELYDPASATRIVSAIGLESDLHLAVEREELHLLYQPIVRLDNGEIVGMEALVRWQHREDGLLTPDRFIDLAERSGLIVPITRWVIGATCRQARTWRDALPREADFYIGINLGQRDLHEADLPAYVATTLEQTGIPAVALRLEVTEGGLIGNVNLARALLAELRASGVGLMLDDFGTGYSSLSYLQLFQFDCLKIDRSFVSRIGADGSNCGIVRAIVHMSKDLGLKTVAEGIESAEIALVLQELGCDFGQGWFYAAPLDGGAMGERLQTQWSRRSGATRRAARAR